MITIQTIPMDDNDCDGVRSWEAWDIRSKQYQFNMDDNDCDGVRSWEDCDDNDNNTPTWMITIVMV